MDREINTNSVLVFILGFISGVLASSFVLFASLVSVFIIFVGLAVLVAERIWNQRIGQEVLFLSLILFSFGFGALRYAIKDFHEALIPSSAGVVINEPEQKENTTRFILRSNNGEKVLVSTDLYSPVQYGDKVEIVGSLQKPRLINDDDGRPFDYASYLSKDDIYFTMNFARVKVLSQGHGNLLKQTLFRFKHSIIDNIKKILAEPESSLLAGLIVAGKAAIPKDILEEFRRAGVIHIIVLSGYNVTIIADFMRKIFEHIFLWMRIGANLSAQTGPRAAASASVLGIIIFVLMTGAEATVVRAALMALTVVAAKMLGRAYSAPRALLGAAFLMVLFNPKILVFDPSFQLSFLAVCGLIYLSPLVERYLGWMPNSLGMRTMLASTIATQATVLPFLIYSTGNVSLVSLPANVLILLFIPATMLAGFLAALVAYVSTIMTLPFSYFTHLLLAWILWVSDYLGNLPLAYVAVPHLPFWTVLLCYAGLIIFVRQVNSDAHKSAS